MVSVIVPVYNVEKYLSACVKSILQQTYQDLECILIDDGSGDGSAAIGRAFAEEDSRVVYVRQENAGVSRARNRGLAQARGEYILFVDSDDILKKDMIEKMMTAMEQDQTDFVVCGIGLFTTSAENITEEIVPPHAALQSKEDAASFFAREYAPTVMNSPCNKLYKKALIQDGFDTSVDIGEDLLFNLAYFRAASSVTYLDQALYCYRRNLSGSLSKKLRGHMYVIANRLYKGCLDYLGMFCSPFETGKLSYFHFKNLQLATLGIIQSGEKKKSKRAALRNICCDPLTVEALADMEGMALGKKDQLFYICMRKGWVRTLYWMDRLWLFLH